MPVHVVRSAKLLESLIFVGCKNAVICSSRFEMAVKAVQKDGNDLLAAQITDHVRLCFATVRQMKLDIGSGQVGVRCRKSSAFRRACSASETIVIEAIVSKIELIRKSSSNIELSMAPAGNTPTKPERPTDALQDLNLDNVDDVRKLFRLGQDCLNGLEAEMDSMTGPVREDMQPEKTFDADGFPAVPVTPLPCADETPRSSIKSYRDTFIDDGIIDGDDESEQSEQAEEADDLDGPPDPCPGRRRRSILAARDGAAVQPQKRAKKHAKVPKRKQAKVAPTEKMEELNEKLLNPHCCVTKDGRCEVTAKGAVTGKRIFITTVKVSCYGPQAVEHMNKLVKHIEQTGCNKKAALALKRLNASTV